MRYVKGREPSCKIVTVDSAMNSYGYANLRCAKRVATDDAVLMAR